jgi:hypothetical protein
LSLELESAGETLWSASSTASRHSSAAETVEAAAATSASSAHLRAEHLHQDFRVDGHALAAHAAASKAFHWVH